MRKAILITFTLFLINGAFAQQLTFNSQYMLNQFLINPAAAGTEDFIPIATSFRQQWAGFKDAPRTQMISAHSKLKDNMGVGGILYNDVTGPLKNIGFQASYSYHVQIDDASKLAFGLSATLSQHVLDGSNFVLNEATDQTLNGASQKSFNPDATFGMYYFGENYFAGLSVPQLLQNKYKFGDIVEGVNRQVRHYYLSGGYTFEAGNHYKIEPSLLFKMAPASPVQFDINTRLIYKENLWAGLSYRNQESVVMMFGIQRDQFRIGYSYDYTTSNIRNYSVGTHELYLEFQLPGKKGDAASM